MTESKPWRKPLKEQQAFAISKEPWQPKSIPKEAWKNIVDSDIINKENTDTKFTLDPPGPRFNVDNHSDEENVDPRLRTKMSLQVYLNLVILNVTKALKWSIIIQSF